MPSDDNRDRKLGDAVEKLVGLTTEVLVLILDLLGKVTSENGRVWIEELKKWLRKETSWEKLIPTNLLGFSMPSVPRRFVVKDRILNSEMCHLGSISGERETFMEWFGDKVEEFTSETPPQLYCYRLARDYTTAEIIAEFGGEDGIKITLAEAWVLMAHQPTRRVFGMLPENGISTLFFASDISGIMRPVLIHCIGGGWGVTTNKRDVEDKSPLWGAGLYLLSSTRPLNYQTT